jgi:hypothetical protein
LRLRKTLRRFSPDVVWCHSVARFIGPAGLAPLLASDAIKIKTYHDLGYFGLYATAFEHESELESAQDLRSFYRKAPFYDKIFPFYILFKYQKLKKLADILRTFELHVVPSDFMEVAVRRYLNADDANVVTLPHAIDL